MSPNEETQNQDAGNPNPSQEAAPEPQAPSSQEVHKAAPEPQASPLEATGKASPSLLRRCWGQLTAGLSTMRWESTDILEDISGILAEVRVPIVLWVFFVFLHKPIEEFAVKLLVAPVLAHFDTGTLSSLLGIGLALALMAYAFLLARRRYIVGGKVVLSAFFILLGYGYYRLGPPDFEFYGLFGQTRTIAFADLIPLACSVPLFLWIRALCTKRRANQERQAPESIEGFLTDHPLTEEEEELSGWTSQAQTLTQKLLATETTHAAFSLGIVASWGEGKSSFMGIMQRYLQQAQREVIVMRFNPWLYDKEAQLTKVFFEELRRTLAPYSSKLSKSIGNYADLLLAVDSSWLKLAHQLLRLSQRSTTEQFDKLSRDIKELGRRVVIFIDDVDRLTREELLELFNLVRNSSNLPCLYFVLAYDKSYVLKTLQGDGEHMSRYPEKILQEEYPLPKLTPDKMWAVLEECLNETQLGKEDEDKVSILLTRLKHPALNLPYHLTTIRMVKRMVNAFNSRYELLHKVGVAPFDLFIFELIYYVYPKVYDFLVEMHMATQVNLNLSRERLPADFSSDMPPFFCIKTNDRGIEYVILPQLEKENAEDIEAILFRIRQLSLGLEDGYKRESIARRIVPLLSGLWGSTQNIAIGRINNKAYWDCYFYRDLLVESLVLDRFTHLIKTTDRSSRAELLKKWSQQNPLVFRQEVLNYAPKNLEEIEAIAYAMFDWNAAISIDLPFKCTEIDEIFNKGNVPQVWKETCLLKILQDKDYLNASFEYTHAWLWSNNTEDRVLSEVSLERAQAALFKEIARSSPSLKLLYTTYWLRCGKRVGPKIKRDPEIDLLMRERISENIEWFIAFILTESGSSIYVLHDIPWNNLTEFDEYLSQYAFNAYIANFREFLRIALEEERRIAKEWAVIIEISSEEWTPLSYPKFISNTYDSCNRSNPFAFTLNYPFYSAPQEGKQD